MNPTLTPPVNNSLGTAVPRDTVPVTSKYSGAPRSEPKDHTMSENIEDLKTQLAAAEAAAKAAEAEAARAKAEALAQEEAAKEAERAQKKAEKAARQKEMERLRRQVEK